MGKKLLISISAFLLSSFFGTWLAFFNPGIGAAASVSIIGAFVIYFLQAK